ncbi:MAG: HAD family hydrolase [Candidatus Altiarchaeota archaeon]
MIDAIFFDLWNTLIYCPTRDRVMDIVRLTGFDLDYDGFISGLKEKTFTDSRVTVRDFMRDECLRRGRNVDESLLDDVGVLWESRLEDTRVFPETEDVLGDLERDYKLALISNLDVSGAEYFKENYECIIRHFDAVLLSCDIGLSKPDARIFLKALGEVGASADSAWMVGDSEKTDVRGALDAGMSGILVDRYEKVFNEEFPVVRSLSEVRSVIEGE